MRYHARSVFLFVLFAVISSVGKAAAVLQVDMDSLLAESALVFEGEVIASHCEWNANQTAILTKITFKIDDTIKGQYPETKLVLSFNGGTIGELSLNIAGMEYPAVGDQGIYFVESLSRQQINPLLGWSQGHFRLRKDSANNVQRVTTEQGQPVLGLTPRISATPGSFVQKVQPGSSHALSHGHAHGLRLGPEGGQGQQKEAFKTELRQRLQLLKGEGR